MTEFVHIPTSLLAAAIAGPHGHRLLAVINDQDLVLAVNEVAYPWHRHPDSDELFIVLSGRLTVESVDSHPIELNAGDVGVIPGGIWHRTIPTGRTVNLILKGANAATEFEENPLSQEIGEVP